jgi:carbon monoxide dehydrogenase subunit G
MAIRIEETVVTRRPRPEVFGYVADFKKVAEWDPGIRSSTRVFGDGGVGTRYEVEATFAGRVVPMTYEVIEHEEPERIVLHGTAPTAEATDDIRFEDDDGGTRIVYRAEFVLKGALRLLGPLLRPIFTRLGTKAMAGLDSTLNN